MITASIVTFCTNIEELNKCLISLICNNVYRIYICDNSPTDDLKNFCSGFKQVIYIFNNKNLGYGAGHNVAIREASKLGSEYHLVINSDVYFGDETLSSIEKYMNTNTDVAQLIPNTIYPDGRIQYVCRLLPTPMNLMFRRFLPDSWVEKMNYKYLLLFNDHKKPMNVPYHQGSFMFFRVKCFEKVGLFDERFFMYPEDIDITRRMYANFKTMFWPEVTIVHAHRAASYKSKKMLFIHMWNMIKYFNKWGWVFDSERRRINKKLLIDYGYNEN